MNTVLFYNIGLSELILIAFTIILIILIIPFSIFDIIKTKEMSNYRKLLWILFIVMAPILGAVIYLLWGRKQKAL